MVKKKRKDRTELQELVSSRNWAKARLIGFRAGLHTKLRGTEPLQWKKMEEAMKDLVDNWDLNTLFVIREFKEKNE